MKQPARGVGEGVVASVIWRLMSVVFEMVPLRPLTLRVNVPIVAAVPAETCRFDVTDPLGRGVTGVGRLMVTPLGMGPGHV